MLTRVTILRATTRARISTFAALGCAPTDHPSYADYPSSAAGTTGTPLAALIIGPRNYRTTLLPKRIDSVSRVVITWFRYTSGSRKRRFCWGPRRESPRVVRHLCRYGWRASWRWVSF